MAWLGIVLNLLQSAQAQCENFEMTVTTTNPLCYNYSDGDIDVFPSGGTGQVWGQISNEDGSITLDEDLTGTAPNQLPAGWYYIYVYDELGCELFDTVYLEDPDEMEIIMHISLPGAVSACDGIATIDTVLHHTGSYESLTFWWSGGPGGLNQTVKSDLCYGEYSIVVNNAIGCGVMQEFTVGNLAVAEEVSSLVQLFPNPAQQLITLQTPQPVRAIFVTDLTGKRVMQLTGNHANTEVLEVGHLPNGIYELVLVFENSVERINFVKHE